MKIGIANDHHGVQINKELTKFLIDLGYDVINYGPTTEESVDYPVYVFKVGEAVRDNIIDFGIVICNTGIGVSIACNKVKKVRCAKVNDELEAKLTREHNNANVIALGSRIPMDQMKQIVKIFLETPFSNEERHIRRNNMIDNYND